VHGSAKAIWPAVRQNTKVAIPKSVLMDIPYRSVLLGYQILVKQSRNEIQPQAIFESPEVDVSSAVKAEHCDWPCCSIRLEQKIFSTLTQI
jgi:hypothetical protein